MNYDQEKTIFDQINVIKSLILNEESDLWIEVDNLRALIVTISNQNFSKRAAQSRLVNSAIKSLEEIRYNGGI